jgi:hypothetical protein
MIYPLIPCDPNKEIFAGLQSSGAIFQANSGSGRTRGTDGTVNLVDPGVLAPTDRGE